MSKGNLRSKNIRLNQFGKPMAEAIPTPVLAWQCSICGDFMPLVDGQKPPKRCSNRKGGCGRMFHNDERKTNELKRTAELEILRLKRILPFIYA